MDMNAVMQAIASLGFPIVACAGMGWYVKYREDRHMEEVDKINEQHKSEMEEMTTAVNNNTLVITKLIERLERGEKV